MLSPDSPSRSNMRFMRRLLVRAHARPFASPRDDSGYLTTTSLQHQGPTIHIASIHKPALLADSKIHLATVFVTPPLFYPICVPQWAAAHREHC